MMKKIKKWWWLKRLDLVMNVAKLCKINITAPHLGKIPPYVIKN